MSAIPVYFRGNIVSILPMEKEDIPLVKNWINDEEISYNNGARLPVSIDEQTAWYEKTARDNTKKKLIICTKEGEKTGMVSLFNIDHKNQNAEVGIYVSGEHQGKGYAKEALSLVINFSFNELNMHKIYATIAEFNRNSIKLFESLGFAYECRKKEDRFSNGRFYDILLYTLFRKG